MVNLLQGFIKNLDFIGSNVNLSGLEVETASDSKRAFVLKEILSSEKSGLLKKYDNIQFSYFETEVRQKELVFHYQLKQGVSQDRLGYLILAKEGVVDLLNNMSKNKY